MSTNGRVWCAILLAAVVILVFLGAAYLRDDSLSRLRGSGVIRIGYAIEPPYAFIDARGRVTGESPEVAKRIVDSLGIGRIQWRQMEFGSLIPELEAGRIDVIAAGLFFTPERARRVRFSTPTFRVHPDLLVYKGNPRGLHSFRQIAEDPSVRLAVLSGSVEESLSQRLGVDPERLVRVPDALTGRVAVESGFADALMLSAPTLRWMTNAHRLGLTQLCIPAEDATLALGDTYGVGAFAFRLEDRALVSAWNAAQRFFIGSEAHRRLLLGFGFQNTEVHSRR
ncbi:ABC-type transporter, periplasmic subunit family 3 [Thiorhodococcus drewsii AZ1]|uniref:ABC-type transporter, periplasmic subunit family 3 n=1 Tax=Thiorhodococcus drewsii AZ1 TaxID=765913 RepID=G2E3I9_9GAMM|nr:ectoine/hydroxyectoine ABC transporter substrate-binding protein EhuB [Thiorhodococcus drewsii]EGV30102.1 ABC-type transporter, periplasmic subunit family 3 [Thiorhodococcus drewsii AZ1]